MTGLKLDRRFVSELTSHDSDANVLSAGLAGLAAGLGLESIAEGIETEEQARLVQAHGWIHGQGYLFDKPSRRRRGCWCSSQASCNPPRPTAPCWNR